MANQSSIFPIFLRAEYREDANGIPQFISRIQQAAKVSEAELSRVGNALNKALSAPRTGAGALDLGIPQLREQIKAQEQAAMAAREVQQALLSVANATGKFNGALTPTINAYRDLAKAKDADAASSRAQLSTLQAVEAELEKGTRAVQARLQAEQSLANFRKTANINEGALRLASGQASVDRAALSGATLQSVLGRTRTSNPLVEQQNAAQAVEAERLARAQAELAASAARLTAQIDPLVAAQQRYDATLAEANRLLQAGAISTQQYAQAQAFASAQLQQVENQVRGVAAAEALRAQQQREAEAAQRALAASAAQLRAELDPMFVAQQRFDQEMSRADDLLRAGAISAREYAAAQQLARNNLREAAQAATQTNEAMERVRKTGTTATQNVINSQRASRTAFIQLGQQLQDVAVQAQMGTNAFLIFGQQAPQAAFALSGLADSANKTQRAIGNIATFLSGPWGAAIFVGVAALGPLVNKLLETEKAAELARTGADNLAAAQSVLGGVFDEVSGKIKTQNDLLLLNARLTALNLQSEALAKRASAANTFRGAQTSTGFDSLFGGGISDSAAARAGVAPRQSRGQTNARQARDLLEGVFSGRISADEALKRSARMDFTGTGATLEEFQQAIIDRAFSKDAERVAKLINDSLDGNNLAPELRRGGGSGAGGGSRRGSAGSRSGGAASGPGEDQIARFQQQAAERVNQINDRFAEQTRLVTQSLTANRQLDQIIAQTNAKMAEAKNLTEAQRNEFEGIVEAAASARDTIDAALVRPFEDLQRESDERLQIEQLLAQGRTDEAAALQIVLQLQRQIGTEAELRAALERAIAEDKKTEEERIRNLLASYNQLMDGVRQRVIDEQRITRELRDQQAVFNAQLSVVDEVRRSLTDILSGRSTDFFGNFRQALQDLQGARLFEDIFGQTFRDIENELQALSPQGKANAAFAAEVERTAAATATVGDAALSLAEQFDRAFGIVGAAANRSLATIGGANDNPPQPMNEMVVTGRRQPEVRLARMSVMELANRLGASIGAGLGAQLEDVFGPRFAEVFGEIAGGAIAGKVTGGNVGALFGGATKLLESGVLGNDNRISEKFGKATEGAAIGSQVAAIGKALGIKGSTTGAQLGGALGSFIPIPGGNIIGAIAGNLLGGLLKKTPRASATIGGAGGSLGITSLTGTSSSLRDAAGNLGNSVLETINRIAEQLGATVNASAGSVSIGQRKGNLRVDTQGRGVTKIGNGAVDFGEDAEAAIAFAVRDLIQDGVITGLRQSEQNLLRAAKDIEEGMRDVLTFRSVFDRLLEIRDPIAFATQQVDREFDRLREVFVRAGATEAEFADLAALKEIERTRAIEEATDRIVGSLRQLLDDLRMGDNGLSLRDRRSNALGRFDALAARVAAGDSTAFDDFADISRQLLDIERQLFGSTQAYFDRLNQVTTLTERAISGQTNVSPIGAAVPSAADESASIARAIESTSAEQVSILRAINDNLITALSPVARPGVSGGGRFDYPLPAMIQNF